MFSDEATFDGKRIDIDTMKKIVLRMQRFGPASVIVGHTNDSNRYEEKEVVGLASNFRVESADDGKVYLVCDIILNDSGLLDKYPRRSIELWDDYTVDPIALLGSSTPKLDLPTVIKYRRSSYMTREELLEIAQQVLDILKETAEWRFLSELQKEWSEFQEALKDANVSPKNQGDTEAAQQSQEETPLKQAREEEDAVKDDNNKPSDDEERSHDEEGLEALDELLSEFLAEEKEEKEPKEEEPSAGEEEKKKEEAPVQEQEKEKYYAYSPTSVFVPEMVQIGLRGSRGNPSAYPTGKAGLYSRPLNKKDLEKRLNSLIEENRKLRDMYRREKRAAILQRLVAEGYNIDVEDELKYTGDMSDSKFVEHVRRVRQYYSRTPTAPINPEWIGTNTMINEEIRNKAIEYAYNNGISFEEALKKLSS